MHLAHKLSSHAQLTGFLFAASCQLVVAQVGMGLAPLRVEMKVKPGSTYSNSLMISNETPETLRVREENLDFFIDQEELPQFRSSLPDRAAHSCREWVKVNPTEFQLAAGENRLIRYTLRFPAEVAEGSFECALGFTTMPATMAGTTGVVTNIRLVTALYATNGTPVPNGEVKSIEVIPSTDATAKRIALLKLENKGSTYFRVNGSLEVLDSKGKSVESVPFRAIPVLPDGIQQFRFLLQSEFEPEQKVRARFNIGAGEVQEVIAAVSAPVAPR